MQPSRTIPGAGTQTRRGVRNIGNLGFAPLPEAGATGFPFVRAPPEPVGATPARPATRWPSGSPGNDGERR